MLDLPGFFYAVLASVLRYGVFGVYSLASKAELYV